MRRNRESQLVRVVLGEIDNQNERHTWNAGEFARLRRNKDSIAPSGGSYEGPIVRSGLFTDRNIVQQLIYIYV